MLARTTILLIALFLVTVTAPAQTRRRSSTPPKQAAAQKVAAVQRQGAVRVADQIKTLTRFIYLLGGVAKGIEATDDAIRRNQAPPAVVDQVNRNKATVKTSLQNVRVGLDNLEIYFRTTPELQRYYIQLAGVAAGAANAEDLAAASQYDRAGRALLEVVNRLTDVLVAMRG